MPFRNTAITVVIQVWDVINGVGKTGQAANLTLSGFGDTTQYTPGSPSITEIDSSNRKGEYSVSLTAGENDHSMNSMGGTCSTAGCVIRPTYWTNETTTTAIGTVAANVTQIDGVTLATHASGEMPSDVRAVNGGSTGATAGILALTGLTVTPAVDTDAVIITPSGTGKAINALGQVNIAPTNANDVALLIDGTTSDGRGVSILANNQNGLYVHSSNAEAAFIQSANSNGVTISSQASSALLLTPNGTGKAIDAQGQISIVPTNTGDSALKITGNSGGAGIDISGDGVGISVVSNTDTGVNVIGGPGMSISANQTNTDGLVLTGNGTGLSINAIVEGLVGIVQSLMLANAANAGKTSGMSTANVTIRDVNDTKDRITATVNSSGDRLTVTVDLT